MNILITAAGEGSRFLQKGIKPPKPLIKVLGIELLIWSLKSFNFEPEDKIYIVTLASHKVKKILSNKINTIYPNNEISWLELSESKNGQLLSALEAIRSFKLRNSLLIHNCDTYYCCDLKEIKELVKKENNFGIIPCFNADGDNWSFVRTINESSSIAIEVQEKKRISKNCSVGTYVFYSCEDLLLISEKYLKNSNNKFSEFYIAPIYQYAIDNSKEVIITEAQKVKLFGTPKELLSSFKISLYELLGENCWNGNQRKTIIVDIDDTICERKESLSYEKATPIKRVCDAIQEAHKKGIYIILFTSRNLRSFQGSIGLINKYTSPILLKWLDRYKIPYDEIYFGKPWGKSVNYIDDKNLSIEEFIENY